MENISNAKIDKLKADMEKTKAKIDEHQTKLRDQQARLRVLEDLEIVARYRQMQGNEELAAKLKAHPSLLTAADMAAKEDTSLDTSNGTE